MEFEVKDYLLNNGYSTECETYTEFFKDTEMDSTEEIVSNIKNVELEIDPEFLSAHEISMDDDYDYNLEVNADNWEDVYTYNVVLTATNKENGHETEKEIPISEHEAWDIYYAVCDTVSNDVKGFALELNDRADELLRDEEYLNTIYPLVIDLCCEKYSEIIDNFDSFQNYHSKLIEQQNPRLLLDLIGEFSAEARSFEYDLKECLTNKNIIWEDALLVRKPHYVESIKIRRDFETALNNVDEGYKLSDKIDYAFSETDISNLAKIHRNGNNELKSKIESLLEDCNFHRENADFAEGNYAKYIQGTRCKEQNGPDKE